MVFQVPKVQNGPVSKSLPVPDVAQQVMRIWTVAKNLTALTVMKIMVLSPGTAPVEKGERHPDRQGDMGNLIPRGQENYRSEG